MRAIKLKYLAGLLTVLMSSHAAYANGTTCQASGNLVCITETFESTSTTVGGVAEDISSYSITNQSGSQIFAFAVLDSSGIDTLSTNLTGWDSATIGVNIWDNTQKRLDGTTLVTGSNPISGLQNLGSFNALFGATTDQNGLSLSANIYWQVSPDNPLADGTTLDGFLYGGLPSSSTFVAFDQSGTLIDSSETFAANSIIDAPTIDNPTVSAVPEPSEYAMLLLGIGMLLLVKRREE